MIRRLLCLTLAAAALGAQDVRKLPAWAAKEVIAAAHETTPADADAWVLLDRTEVAYVGDGEIRTHRTRVVRILTEAGLQEAVYAIHSLGGKASKVKKLHCWNLRPDGELMELDQNSAMILDDDRGGQISTSLMTATVAPRAVIQSIVAFESVESVRNPMGPVDIHAVMETVPVRHWELEAATSGGWFTNLDNVSIHFDLHHFAPWIPAPQVVQDKTIVALGVPQLPKQEGAAPSWMNATPWVLVSFADPALKTAPAARSWDALATWVDGQYQPKFQPSKVVEASGSDPKAALMSIHEWMKKELTYKAVYLSPERGWIPAAGPDVVRHRYGDCKDLATCLLSEAKGFGMEVHPVLARIVEGRIEADEPPQPFAFNHAIAAIKLTSSMGFPAEFDTPKGRFLLVDPTSRLTPLGYLPDAHLGRRLMICTGDGAVWVTVPASTIQRPSSLITIDGTVDASMKVSAEIRIAEVADHLGLRIRMLMLGQKALRDRLVSFLELPPTGTLEVISTGDPLDLSKPFEVTLKAGQPEGLRRGGEGFALPSWGLPKIPARIQRTGEARRFPVESEAQGHLELRANYHLPFGLSPRLSSLDVETPFRTLKWTAEVGTGKGEPSLTLACVEEEKPALFAFGHQEEGATEWKRDRNQVSRLHKEGLELRRKD